MKRFINWLITSETEKTPILDKAMIAGAVVEVAVMLFIIAFFIKLGTLGMVI